MADGASADAVPVASLTLTPGATRDLSDTYVDTDDWRLHRAGFALRVRRRGDTAVATLKSLERAEGDLQQRTELEQNLAEADGSDLSTARGAVSDLVRVLAGRRRTRALFEVQTRRQVLTIQVDGVAVGEVVLDETAIPLPDGQEPVQLQRVEVEVEPAVVDAVAPFVAELRDACGLRSVDGSKFEAGLQARGLTPVGVPELGPSVVDASMSAAEAAYAVLRGHFGSFLAHEPGTRLGDDPEELHDMRVATRRLRAVLALFAEVLPEGMGYVREELRWVGQHLGAVRDLDVQIARMQAWIDGSEVADAEALTPLVRIYGARRDAARAGMLRALDTRRYDRLVAAFTRMLVEGPVDAPAVEREPVLVAAPAMIEGRYRKLRKAGRKIDARSAPEEYHTLRIRGKRLRYAVETLAHLYGKPATRFLTELVKLQDVLGDHQDACIAVEQLREMSLDGRLRLPPRTVFAMGELAERYARLAEAQRAAYPRVFARLTSKRWRRLRAVVKKRARTAAHAFRTAHATPDKSTAAVRHTEEAD